MIKNIFELTSSAVERTTVEFLEGTETYNDSKRAVRRFYI